MQAHCKPAGRSVGRAPQPRRGHGVKLAAAPPTKSAGAGADAQPPPPSQPPLSTPSASASGADGPSSRPPPAAPLSTLSASYSAAMAAAMPGPALSYNHEAGINWTPAPWCPSLLIGSCPQSPADVARLAREAGVKALVSLQEPSDLAHFGIDGDAIARAAAEAGITLYRVPIRDFDPASLRAGLPGAVAVLETALSRGGNAYVHCTAGMGRAPAVALAHAAWVCGERLAEASAALKAARPCNPRVAAVRGAGADLILGPGALVSTTLRIPDADLPPGTVSVAIAGLDVGWGGRLPCLRGEVEVEAGGTRASTSTSWSLTRPLPPGKHPFKLVVTGSPSTEPTWLTTPAYPTLDEGGNVNNTLEVAAPSGGVAGFTRHRLLNDELLPDEQAAAAAAVRALAVEAVPKAEAAGKPAPRGLWAGLRAAFKWLVEVADG